MTQLNLSGRQPNNTQQKPGAEPEGGSIKNQTVGALGALAMFAAVIVIGSCSRSSPPVAVQKPIQPTAPVSAPAVTAPIPAAAPVEAKAKSKTKRRRAATLSYVNRDYGLSFKFPRGYELKTGDKASVVSAMTTPVQMNFVHPGGLTLAAVELPGNSYPGTDFESAFVNVSVNSGMTSEACSQFAFPEADPGAEVSAPVTIGAIAFNEVENSSGGTMKPADAKYYHVFRNGACYEFALGIATEDGAGTEGITPVDRNQVFAKLEKILATVKLPPAAIPETQTPVPAVVVDTPADASNTAQHTAQHTPEQDMAPNF